MIFVVKQKVTHPLLKTGFEKEVKIVGHDLRHAITMIKCSESMRRDLEKKHRATQVDADGRTLTITIVEELKA